MRFSGLLNLLDFCTISHVYTLNPGNTYRLADGIDLRVLPANHDEVIARDQAVGLAFTFLRADRRTITASITARAPKGRSSLRTSAGLRPK
jgi:hypothetical protein